MVPFEFVITKDELAPALSEKNLLFSFLGSTILKTALSLAIISFTTIVSLYRYSFKLRNS